MLKQRQLIHEGSLQVEGPHAADHEVQHLAESHCLYLPPPRSQCLSLHNAAVLTEHVTCWLPLLVSGS